MGLIKRQLEPATRDNFWNGIKVYLKQPNAINKEVLTSELIWLLSTESEITEAECQSVHNKLHDLIIEDKKIVSEVVTDICSNHNFTQSPGSDVSHIAGANYFMFRTIVPKKSSYSDVYFYELCFLDIQRNIARFYTLFDDKLKTCLMTHENFKTSVHDPYVIIKFKKISVQYDNQCLLIEHEDDLGDKGLNWIQSIFITKLTKLIKSDRVSVATKASLSFSSQIDVIMYYKLYEAMKAKYAKYLIENWSENTDPQKFVFEDIGIATYLLLLWNDGELPGARQMRKQKFMDLGCGNGLLVYILSSEGHQGIGLDIRKRKIWQSYPDYVVLKEETVIPGPGSVYPDADWLIGNHSDELTPWLPIMARRSTSACQYFVLPCCPYQLNGRVYQRKNSGMSVYHDFIHYVRGISQVCGFDTSIDKLRIPSTKRICIIGRGKEMSGDEMRCVQERIDEFIRKETGGTGNDVCWVNDYKVRPAVETVRNCTQLPKEMINKVVCTIVNALLREVNSVTVEKDGVPQQWNQGGSLQLNELAGILSRDELKIMKNECKGLQTLIRNHHHVFRVTGGVVRLRSPREMSEMTKVLAEGNKFKWKERQCWFASHHPHGCPLSDESCSYKHL